MDEAEWDGLTFQDHCEIIRLANGHQDPCAALECAHNENFEMLELATVENWSYERIAELYEISEDKVEQIVLSFMKES